MKNKHIITLTTDFGLQDEYVGTMKGVILSKNPNATIVDITHNIKPQDIRSASFIFNRAYRFFPPDTIHILVVDPGVGSSRNILAVKKGGQYFIAPDNGLLTPIFTAEDMNDASSSIQIFAISNSELFLPGQSSTFHGRDIMAPVAAALSNGMNIAETGEELVASDCITLPKPRYLKKKDAIEGEIIHIDHFGNLIANIIKAELISLTRLEKIQIRIGTVRINRLSRSYSDEIPGKPLAHFDSHNHLEISCNSGSAANLLGIKRGDRVDAISIA